MNKDDSDDEEKVKGHLNWEQVEEWATLQAAVLTNKKWSVVLGEEADTEERKDELQKEKDDLLQKYRSKSINEGDGLTASIKLMTDTFNEIATIDE